MGHIFRLFREQLLAEASLRSFYLFDNREEAFRDDAVLQETIITSAVAGVPQLSSVQVITAHSPADEMPTVQEVAFEQVVYPHDPERFIHLIPHQEGQIVATRMQALPATLATLGLSVSTGRVVDFRAATHLRTSRKPKQQHYFIQHTASVVRLSGQSQVKSLTH